ncbi:MAG: S1-C subfamily serine protease [Candidatus Paceibacteria bacterium]|jgi:S1-C subfamily serine protease
MKTKKIYRVFIDLLVIGMAVYMILPWVVYYLPGEYFNGTIPDETLALMEITDNKFLEVSPNFQELLNNPTNLGNYDLIKSNSNESLSGNQIYSQNIDGIVYIEAEVDGEIYYGSGSIMTPDGLILTNYHVIEGADKVLTVTSNENIYEVVEVVAYDIDLDIVFLRINADNLHPVTIGGSENLKVGSPTFIIGHPEGFLNTISSGIISGFRDYSSQDIGMQIQITNPISDGNSGGALLNEYGELIGVPAWSLEYEDNLYQIQNINFAIPIDSALELLRI